MSGRVIASILAAGLAAIGIGSCGGSGGGGGTARVVRLDTFLTGLASPVLATNAADGTGRMFFLERAGRILVLASGGKSPAAYLDVHSRVLSGGERGLLGLAFHPQFKTNRRFFVNYTRVPDGATVISEYRQNASNSNTTDLTETILLVIPQPFENHNGGMLAFGPDRLLYIGMGDGGSGNDPQNNAQNPLSLLGKMLRIDIDHSQGSVHYAIPPDNPYVVSGSGRGEIYAIGLRNPWRYSFDRATGELIAGDVGQDAREEVDRITRGANYGWRILEGTSCTGNDPQLCGNPGFTPPLLEYNHAASRCAVIGGYVYRGTKATLPSGVYLYGDYCTGEIWQLQNSVPTLLLNAGQPISSFGEDEAGELYVVGLNGTVFRISS